MNIEFVAAWSEAVALVIAVSYAICSVGFNKGPGKGVSKVFVREGGYCERRNSPAKPELKRFA